MRVFNSHTLFVKLAIAVFLLPYATNAQVAGFQDIELNNIATGEDVKLVDFRSAKAVVVVFFCNSCPYSIFYTKRLMQMQNDFPQAKIVLVNASKSSFVPEESDENLRKFIDESDLNLPYLKDQKQMLKKGIGARKCPEAYLFSPSNNWRLEYTGALDDNPQIAKDVDNKYLEEAIKEVLAGGRVSKPNIRPTGCTIK